jgi:KipI family sensor histidine kinase inhibitor
VNAPRIREAGDSALLLELDEVIDVGVNARAIAIAAAVRESQLPGVRDVVPTYRSVTVHFDPFIVCHRIGPDAIDHAVAAPAIAAAGKTVDVDVKYGADAGPDLEEVAQFANLSSDEIVDVHSSTSYRVFMIGFLPGFATWGASMHGLRCRAARRRACVCHRDRLVSPVRRPVSYPRESPGGWRLIGRTPVRVFDSTRNEPCLFTAGDTVRFRPIPDANFPAGESPAGAVPARGDSSVAST